MSVQLTINQPVAKVAEFRRKYMLGRIKCGDALLYLQSLKRESAALVFLDPPFNLGKRYGHSAPRLDRQADAVYEIWMTAILMECCRILMPGGSLYLYHLPRWAMKLGPKLDGELSFRHWIAVSMKNGFARGRKLYPAHYALLKFSKGEPVWFNRPKISPQECASCGEYAKDYGGYRQIIDTKGINLSDIWDDLSPVRHGPRKHRKANELPERFFERIMSISSAPQQTFVDPFAGTGSGVVAAAKAGMRFTCCDLLPSNCELIKKRLSSLKPSDIRTEAI